MSANVTATMNGIQSMSSCFNPIATRIGETFAYCLLFLVSLVGNTFIAMIVFKTKTLRKPINFLIVNMAMSDMLVPIFLFPRELVLTYTRSWVIDGLLGQVLCKLSIYASNLSFTVSIQSLVLIAVDRFGAVMFPLCGYLLPKPVRLESCRVSRGAGVCGWLGGRIRRVVVLQKLRFGDASCNFLYPFGFDHNNLLRHYVKNQIPEDSRRAIN